MRSENIRTALCDLSKESLDQNIRLTAAQTLIPFQDTKNIDCLKGISRENHQPASSKFGVADAVAMFFTLGLSNLMKGIQENKSRSDFLARQNDIRNHLQFLELKAKE